jgi:hypothetical protein
MTAFRWICVLPATVAVHFLFSTAFYNAQHVVGWFGAPFILLRVSWAAFLSLVAGAWIAPAHRVLMAWVLFALYALLTLGVIVQLATTGADRVPWVAGGIEAFALLFGAWGAAVFWSRKC